MMDLSIKLAVAPTDGDNAQRGRHSWAPKGGQADDADPEGGHSRPFWRLVFIYLRGILSGRALVCLNVGASGLPLKDCFRFE